jgi:hypothetical protein
LSDLQLFIASFSSKLGINPYEPIPKKNVRLIVVVILTMMQQTSIAHSIYESWPSTSLMAQALMNYSVGIQVSQTTARRNWTGISISAGCHTDHQLHAEAEARL